MRQATFLAAVSVALASVLLFSGQQSRQVAPPKPVTAPAAPAPSTTTSVAQMPHNFWLLEDVKFPPSRNVTLVGDPATAGLYVTRTLIPKGTQGVPHSHPDFRTVVVLSGTCYYGLGEEFNEKNVLPLPPGSFFTEPPGVAHFTWAKDGDVILQTTAIGPSRTQIVPDKKPSPSQGRP